MAQNQNQRQVIYKRLQNLAAEKGMSFASFCEKAGVSESTFYNARRDDRMLSYPVIERFCTAAEISMVDFFVSLSKTGDRGRMTKDEAVLIEFYREVDPAEKEYILAYAEMTWNKCNEKRKAEEAQKARRKQKKKNGNDLPYG